MFTEQGTAAQALGDRVRAASRYRGPWPKISVWHGACDPIVRPSNGEDIIRQWTNVHGLSESPSHHEFIENHTRRVWRDANGKALIEAFSISGMMHGVPLATTTEESCGSAGAFFLDVGISSTHHITRFFCLHESLVEMPRAAAPVPATIQIPADGGALVIAGTAAEGAHTSAEASFAEGENRQTRYPLDPNAVIAAAFKAAGLPIPEFPSAPPGMPPRVAPGPIIAAALKAAGLMRS
jgi:feruloyl esterase